MLKTPAPLSPSSFGENRGKLFSDSIYGYSIKENYIQSHEKIIAKRSKTFQKYKKSAKLLLKNTRFPPAELPLVKPLEIANVENPVEKVENHGENLLLSQHILLKTRLKK